MVIFPIRIGSNSLGNLISRASISAHACAAGRTLPTRVDGEVPNAAHPAARLNAPPKGPQRGTDQLLVTEVADETRADLLHREHDDSGHGCPQRHRGGPRIAAPDRTLLDATLNDAREQLQGLPAQRGPLGSQLIGHAATVRLMLHDEQQPEVVGPVHVETVVGIDEPLELLERGCGGVVRFLQCVHETPARLDEQGKTQLLLTAEVQIHGPFAELRPFRDLVHRAGMHAPLEEDGAGRVQDGLAARLLLPHCAVAL